MAIAPASTPSSSGPDWSAFTETLDLGIVITAATYLVGSIVFPDAPSRQHRLRLVTTNHGETTNTPSQRQIQQAENFFNNSRYWKTRVMNGILLGAFVLYGAKKIFDVVPQIADTLIARQASPVDTALSPAKPVDTALNPR